MDSNLRRLCLTDFKSVSLALGHVAFYISTTAGFEPAHTKHNGLAGHLLNHSDKLSLI